MDTPQISMQAHFAVALVFLLASIGFVLFNILVPKLIHPSNPYPEKLANYECGEIPKGTPWIRFNIRYYIVAILFLIFDVEVLFIIPWAVVYKNLFNEIGLLVFIEMFIFVLILGVGLAYCWVKGHLEWVLRDARASRTDSSAS